ncbi:MAG: flavodoxin family protein [Clostridiales Family XIII bacterium]|jgi:multimeric flavodoxin WrbA|nr:flavodoxin family protein [Clostridiales Family XIII bacterium]
MKILVLNGSPRNDGNTEAIVDAFAEGAQGAGHEVVIVNVAKKKIAACLGCEYCHTKGEGQCIQKDDMAEIYEALTTTDLLVWASPVYYFTFTPQFQAALSRTYAIGAPENLSKSALLLTSGSPNVYGAAIEQYKHVNGFWGVEDKGVRTVFGPNNKSAEALADAKSFGASL